MVKAKHSCWWWITSTRGPFHDDVIKWKHFPRYRPFVWGIPRSPVNSPHKGQCVCVCICLGYQVAEPFLGSSAWLLLVITLPLILLFLCYFMPLLSVFVHLPPWNTWCIRNVLPFLQLSCIHLVRVFVFFLLQWFGALVFSLICTWTNG